MKDNQRDFGYNAMTHAGNNVDLLIRKNKQYGGENILQTGVHGVAVRLMDKVNRAFTMTKGDVEPEFESIYDTFQDIANYGVIGQMLLNYEWPGQQVDNPTAAADDPTPPSKYSYQDWEWFDQFSALVKSNCFCFNCARWREMDEFRKTSDKTKEALTIRTNYGAAATNRDFASIEINPPVDGYEEKEPAYQVPDQTGMVYLCGPIDNVGREEAMGWRQLASSLLAESGWASFNPAGAVTNGDVARREVQSICVSVLPHCKYVLVHLPEGQPAFGSIIELSIAASLNVEVVVVSDWVHRSIFSEGLRIFSTVEEAVEYITNESYRDMINFEGAKDTPYETSLTIDDYYDDL